MVLKLTLTDDAGEVVDEWAIVADDHVAEDMATLYDLRKTADVTTLLNEMTEACHVAYRGRG